MNKREARSEGVAAGYQAGLYNDTEEDAFEAEENARQYSPFEFLASEMNRSRDPDGLWDAYDEGVAVGVRKALRERRGRRNPGRPAASDSDAVRELVLYGDTTGALYGQKQAIQKNLVSKMASGTYSNVLAVKAWENFAEAAAKRYAKEFLTPRDKWHVVFSPATRYEAAL
ncbi:MAG: hypothetical protein ABIK85_04060, partial [Candidatus Eisenbacteria bacterium]